MVNIWFELVTRGVGPVLTQGYHMNELDKGQQGDATYQLEALERLYRSTGLIFL